MRLRERAAYLFLKNQCFRRFSNLTRDGVTAFSECYPTTPEADSRNQLLMDSGQAADKLVGLRYRRIHVGQKFGDFTLNVHRLSFKRSYRGGV